ncbi:hypothetical protein AAG906_006747 [Vitis piasezkii]
MAVGVVKNPLMHCKAALEDLLVSKPNQVGTAAHHVQAAVRTSEAAATSAAG